jgi:large subunit ribosomal protein L19e
MKLDNQKTISAKMLGVGKSKVWFNNDRLDEIKEAITKRDIKSLIKKRIIQRRPLLGSSRIRARKRLTQKRKEDNKALAREKGACLQD